MEKSPLKRLSAELRNNIYEFTFANTTVYLDKSEENTALLRTCKQIRSECRLLVFSTAKIQLSPEAVDWVRPKNEKKVKGFDRGMLPTLLVHAFGIEPFRALPHRQINIKDDTWQGALRFDCPTCDSLGVLRKAIKKSEEANSEEDVKEESASMTHKYSFFYCWEKSIFR